MCQELHPVPWHLDEAWALRGASRAGPGPLGVGRGASSGQKGWTLWVAASPVSAAQGVCTGHQRGDRDLSACSFPVSAQEPAVRSPPSSNCWEDGGRAGRSPEQGPCVQMGAAGSERRLSHCGSCYPSTHSDRGQDNMACPKAWGGGTQVTAAHLVLAGDTAPPAVLEGTSQGRCCLGKWNRRQVGGGAQRRGL